MGTHAQNFRKLADKGWFNTPTDILDMRLDDIHIRMGQYEGGYGIYWSDYVANDWTVWLPQLSDALAFAGFLAYCREHDFRTFLNCDPAEFSAQALYREVTA